MTAPAKHSATLDTLTAVFVYPHLVSGHPVIAYAVGQVRETPAQWVYVLGTAEVVWDRRGGTRFGDSKRRYWKGASGEIGYSMVNTWRLARVLSGDDAPRALVAQDGGK